MIPEFKYVFTAGWCNMHMVFFLGRWGWADGYSAKAWDMWKAGGA
jgi:hypothetical protein